MFATAQRTKKGKPARKLPPDNVILADLKKGYSNRVLGARYGVAPETVSIHIRRMGWDRDRIISDIDDVSEQLVMPSPRKIVNHRGHSLPRVVCVYGEFKG